MNVLVCGARGFVGRAVVEALRRRGHRAIEGVSERHPSDVGDAVAMDFARDTEPALWLPRLRDVDAVVNAVGVLRDSRRRPIAAVHAQTPAALFEACARAGVRRVVQVSALGIAGSQTAYTRTKRDAEERLAALTSAGRLDGVVVRPSVVFGARGESSRLFLALSRLPVLALPRPVRRAMVQPIAVDELAQGIVALVENPGTDTATLPASPAIVDAVGPEPLTLAAFIASLRAQAGRAPARVLSLPDLVTRWSARAGDALPVSPWCSETLALLGTDNVAPPLAFERLLGRPATRYDQLLRGVVA